MPTSIMRVRDLKAAIAALPDDMMIAAMLERTDGENELLSLEDVTVARGTPSRADDGRPLFRFDGNGPAEWAFLGIAEDIAP